MKVDDTRSIQTTAEVRPDCRAAPVLVVDDDDSIRETLRFALEDEGYVVLEAQDGAVALDMMRAAACGMVVLLDHVMPLLDGESMLRRLAQEQSVAERHAYVMITASSQVANLEATLTAIPLRSPVAVVRKPFDLETLFGVVLEASNRILSR